MADSVHAEAGARSRLGAVAAWALGYNSPQLSAGMVAAALPLICTVFGVTSADGLWLVNAYGLGMVIAILPGSALADSVGYKRIFILGNILATAMAAAGAFTPDFGVLVGARFFQGLGSGVVVACLGHFVRATYPADRMGRGLVINATMVQATSAAGPAVAALILAIADWRWVFGATAIQGVLCLALAAMLRPYPAQRRPLDLGAVLLNAISAGALILAAQAVASGRRWGEVAAELGLALVAGFLLVRRELGRERPMLAVDLIRIPVIRLSVVTMGLCFGAFGMLAGVLPFFLHVYDPGSPLKLGLLLAAQPIGATLTGPLAARLSDRYSVGLVGGLGMALFAAGVLSLVLAPPGTGFGGMFLRILLIGVGYALFGPTNTRGMIMGAPKERTGAATGLNAVMRSLSVTIGGALAAVVLGLAAGGEATLASTRAVLLVALGMGGVGAVLSLARARLT